MMEFLVSFTYPRIVVNNMNIVYCIIAIMIEERLKIVNEMFHKLNQKPKGISVNVTKLVAIHRILVNLCQQLNSVFALQFLLWISQSFILVLNDVHLGIYRFFFEPFSLNFFNIFIYVKNSIIYVFDLYYLSKRSARLCFEVTSIC
jgi:hypothetical protein